MTCDRPEERGERVGAQLLGTDHPVGLEEADIVDEDLPQALARVDDVDGAAPILLGHGGPLRQARVGLLAHRREHLQVMVDPAQLIGDLDEAELRPVPHVRRQLAGDARTDREGLDVLVEVLVDTVDEDGQRRLHGPEPRHEVSVGVGRAALELARGEIEEPDEMIDDAMEPMVVDQAGEPRADRQPVHCADVLEGGEGDGREPQLRPRERGRGEECDGFPAEDLVADGLVEQVAGGQTCRPAVALVEDPLGLEEQRLPEPLGGDDDELVVPVRGQEAVDLGRPVEQGLVEVLCHSDVVGVNGPGAHAFPQAGCGGHEDNPSR